MQRTFATAALLTVTGCASVTGTKLQSISVQSVQDKTEVAGAGCTLSNDVGTWRLTTPGSVTVAKSTADLSVECKNESGLVGQEVVSSKANPSAWGNLLLGGPVGYVIDRKTGAGFDYPGSITVTLKHLDALVLQPQAPQVAERPQPLPQPIQPVVEVMPVKPPKVAEIPAQTEPVKPQAIVAPRKRATSYWE